MFKLKDGFINKYKTIKPPFGFNGLGEITYYRTYSRLKEDGTNEQWYETIRRVVEGTYTIQKQHILEHTLGWEEDKAHESAEEMYDRMFNMKFLPPGRGLWAMGSPIITDKKLFAALNNCAFVSTETIDKDKAKPFAFMMDMSMLGVGTGFDVKGANKLRILKPYEGFNPSTIPDTREGWVESLKTLLNAFFEPNSVLPDFNYSEIREKGLLIKTFGGKSSGSEPLKKLHDQIFELLQSRIGDYLSATDITDIMNMIGVCVVSGNVRRCLPKGTLIHTENGLIPIEKIKPGMKAVTISGFDEISELVEQGKQEVISIHTQLGIFKCTPDHKIAKLTNTTAYEWVKAKDLLPNDRLVFSGSSKEIGSKQKLPTWNYEKPEHSTTCKDITIPENINYDIAWMLGVFHGDGYVYPNFDKNGFNAYVSFSCDPKHTNLIKRLERIITSFNVNLCNVLPTEKDNSLKIRAQSKQLAWYLSKFKIANETISIPDCILQGDYEIRASYLAGLFDSDGAKTNRPLIAVTSVYPTFLKEVQALYATLGIPTRLKLKRSAIGKWKDLYDLSIVGEESKLGFKSIISDYGETSSFIIKNKTNRSSNGYTFPSEWWTKNTNNPEVVYERIRETNTSVEQPWMNEIIPIKVNKIEYSGEIVETYDISVPNSKEFIADFGILVHNTAQIVFGESDDEEYLKLKDYKWDSNTASYTGSNSKRAHWGWASNNSIFAKIGMDYKDVAKQTASNGEPGYAWLDNMQGYSRMNNGPDYKDHRVLGGNPCFTYDTPILTVDDYMPIGLLANIDGGNFDFINKDGEEVSGKVWYSGDKETIHLIYNKNGIGNTIKCTPNHIFMLNDGSEIEAKDTKGKKLMPFYKIKDLTLANLQLVSLGFVQGDGRTNPAKRQKIVTAIFGKKDYDVEKYFDKTLTYDLLEDYGFDKNKLPERNLPKIFKEWSIEEKCDFLTGVYSANGSVLRKAKRITLKSTNYNLVLEIKNFLEKIDVYSYITVNKEKLNKFYNGEYICKESYDLNIANFDSIILFASHIGFIQDYKRKLLEEVILDKSPIIQHIVKGDIEPVYDFSLKDDKHWGVINGFIAHNCLEQSLESYEMCCLVEVFPTKHDNIKDFLRTLKFAYLYAKTVTLGTVNWPETNRVQLRNRRIGTSITGVAQFVEKNGIDTLKEWLTKGYDIIQKYDAIYSDWLAIPKSIKTTSIKPSGSISLLPGVTPGMHYPESNYYIRRIRIANNSDLLEGLRNAGYVVELDVMDPSNTSVVEFPVSIEGIRTIDEVSIWEQAALASFLQKYWADNQVSCTITFKEHEKDQIEHVLNYYQYQLKGVSFLPKTDKGVYAQMPYESISKEQYEEMLNNIREFRINVSKEEAIPERFCNNDTCEI